MIKNTNKYKLRKLSVGLVSVCAGVLLMQAQQKVTKAAVVNDVNKTPLTVQTNSQSQQSAKANLANRNVQNPNNTVGQEQNKAVESVRTNLTNANAENVNNKSANNSANENINNANNINQNAQKGIVSQKQKVNVNYQKSSGVSTQANAVSGQKLIANNNVKGTINSSNTQNNKVENDNLNAVKAPQTSAAVSDKSVAKTSNIDGNKGTDLAQKASTTLDVKADKAKAINQKSLLESKAVDTTTNGGFDEKTWGKLDVTKWKGKVAGNYYRLNSYTGDIYHVIVPNEADFEKAGISTGGKQVGVTRKFMSHLFSELPDGKAATWAFSKTNNKKVKAIGKNWENTWGSDNDDDGTMHSGSLSYFDGSGLDVSNITNMNYMFSALNTNHLSGLSNWNVSNVTDMGRMFYSAPINDLTEFANWNVANVTNMSQMFFQSKISDLAPLTNWNVANVTDMNNMFYANAISDLTPLTNWKVNNVTDMSSMFYGNQISDLIPLTNWKVNNVTDMSSMFYGNQNITDLTPLINWNVTNVTDMNNMFYANAISDLTPLANWNVSNVTNMSAMFESNKIQNLSPLANWKVSNVTDMSGMFSEDRISNLSGLSKWDVSNVTDMNDMFFDNLISDLTPLANWNVSNVTDMSDMFYGTETLSNQISNLMPLANWNVSNVTDMSSMFFGNQISDLTPLAKWKPTNVTNITSMFDDNDSNQPLSSSIGKRTIIITAPDGKKTTIVQTVNFNQSQHTSLITKYASNGYSQPDNYVPDWATKTVTKDDSPQVVSGGQNSTDGDYNEYTVPTIDGYTPTQTYVEDQEAKSGDNIVINISYKANQKVTIEYVDDDSSIIAQYPNGKVVGTPVVKDGTVGQDIDLSTLENNLPDGYILDDSKSNATSYKLTDASNQKAIIYLKHDMIHDNFTKKVGTRTITVTFPVSDEYYPDEFVDEYDGQGINDGQPQNTVTRNGQTCTLVQTVHFVRDAYIDAITKKVYHLDSIGKYVAGDSWKALDLGQKNGMYINNGGKFSAVTMPDIYGYEANQSNINEITANPGDSIAINITYTPVEATVHFQVADADPNASKDGTRTKQYLADINDELNKYLKEHPLSGQIGNKITPDVVKNIIESAIAPDILYDKNDTTHRKEPFIIANIPDNMTYQKNKTYTIGLKHAYGNVKYSATYQTQYTMHYPESYLKDHPDAPKVITQEAVIESDPVYMDLTQWNDLFTSGQLKDYASSYKLFHWKNLHIVKDTDPSKFHGMPKPGLEAMPFNAPDFPQITGYKLVNGERIDIAKYGTIIIYTQSSTDSDHPVVNLSVKILPHEFYVTAPKKVTINFVDIENRQSVVSTISKSNTPGKTVNFTLTVPTNYELAPGQKLPTTVTVGNTDSTINIRLIHQRGTITYNNPSTTITGAKQDDLNTKTTRTVTITFPAGFTPKADWAQKYTSGQNTITHNGNTYTIVQTINYARNAFVDKVTGKVFYYSSPDGSFDNDGWSAKPGTSDKYSQIRFQDPSTDDVAYEALDDNNNQIDNVYDPNHPDDDDPDYVVEQDYGTVGENPVINIHFVKDSEVTIQYVDDDDNEKVVDDDNGDYTNYVDDIPGKTVTLADEDITFKIPTNYQLAPGQKLPTTVTVGKTDSTINIHLVHVKQTIPYTKPSTTLTGAKQDDLNSVGTRTIVFNFPSNYTPLLAWINKYASGQNTITHVGNSYTIVQTIHFVRNAVLDKVTNKISYINPGGSSAENYSAIGHETDNWGLKPGDSDEYSPVIVPKIDGYKAKLTTDTDKNGLMMFAVSFMMLPNKPTKPINNNQPTKAQDNSQSNTNQPATNPVQPNEPVQDDDRASSTVAEPTQPVSDDSITNVNNVDNDNVDDSSQDYDDDSVDDDDDLDIIPAETHVRATHDGSNKGTSSHIRSSLKRSHSTYEAPKRDKQAQTINHIAQALRLVDSDSKPANEAQTNHVSTINKAASTINPISGHTAYADTIKLTDNVQAIKAHSQASTSHTLPQTGENADEVIASIAGALAEVSAITALAGTRKKRV